MGVARARVLRRLRRTDIAKRALEELAVEGARTLGILVGRRHIYCERFLRVSVIGVRGGPEATQAGRSSENED